MATSAPPARPAAQTARPQRPSGGVRGFANEAGELVVFAAQALKALPRVPRYSSEVLRQASILVRGSTFFILIMTGFIGFAVVTAGYYFLRAAGGEDALGLFTGLTTPRASTPIMFGYVFAAKVGCGLVAEIGTMRINEEVDALESEGIDPIRYVVATRLAGALLFVPIAVGVALISNTLGLYIDAVLVLQSLPSGVFLHNHFSIQTFQDQLLAFISCTSTAIVIVIVSCFYGFRASGGPAGVGAAVTRSLVVNLVLAHIIVAFWVTLFFGPDPRLPFGG